jgi:hypothetical protein
MAKSRRKNIPLIFRQPGCLLETLQAFRPTSQVVEYYRYHNVLCNWTYTANFTYFFKVTLPFAYNQLHTAQQVPTEYSGEY